MMRDAETYLRSLRDRPLFIWYKGQRIHPLQVSSMQKQATVVADYYEHHHRDARTLGESEFGVCSATQLIPYTPAILVKKAESYLSLARNYNGILGRPPDYINAVISTWAGCAEAFGEYAQNVRDFHKKMIKQDLFVAHSTSELKGGTNSGIRVVGENDAGIFLSGARAMATSAAFCDELLIAPTRLSDDDERKAVVCVLPVEVEGLSLICRKNLGDGGSSHLSRYYDESDALVILKNVFVPWNRVFAYRSLERYRNLVKETGTSFAASLQTNARAIAKLETILGLLAAWKKIYPKNSNQGLSQTVGLLVRDVQILKSLQTEAIAGCEKIGACFQPKDAIIESAKMYFMESYPKIIARLRKDLGPELFYVFESDEISETLANELCAQWGIDNQAFAARQKVSIALYDLLVSSFGVRQELYEQFYAGSPENGLANYGNAYLGRYANIDLHQKLLEIDRDFAEQRASSHEISEAML